MSPDLCWGPGRPSPPSLLWPVRWPRWSRASIGPGFCRGLELLVRAQTDRHRETQTHAHRHTKREIHAHKDTKRETHTHAHRDTQREKHTHIHTETHKERNTHTHAHRHTKSEKHTHTHTDLLKTLDLSPSPYKLQIFPGGMSSYTCMVNVWGFTANNKREKVRIISGQSCSLLMWEEILNKC